jgi:hypothetical protein
MQEIELGWDQVARIAWLLLWRGALGGFALSFALGLAINLGLGMGLGIMLSTNVNMAMGVIVALLWWPFAVRMAFRKRYANFRIALVPNGA